MWPTRYALQVLPSPNFPEALKRASQICVDRAEAAIASDPTNTGAFAKGSHALAALGLHDRARDWIKRASLLDPESATVPYNLACTLLCELGDEDAALDMMEKSFARTSKAMFRHSLVDPDLDPLRDNPRFKAMEAAAWERLGL